LRVTADRPALLVVLDNHYPAWHAWVGDEGVPIFRANHAFRAIPVRAGEHTVSFHYEPEQLSQGAHISLGVMLLLLGTIVAGAWRDARDRRGAA
jgi:uncharacterized membrane protein YfhO